MLLIHKPRNHKLLILVITSICGIGALLGFSALTYTPELSHADSIDSNETRSLANITYMQEMTTEICHDSAENESNRLIDIRDKTNSYRVTKLKDGNCWMTENLRIADKTISSADSDMKTGEFTIPASKKAGFIRSDKDEGKVYIDDIYGGYYNFYTASAGTGDSTLAPGTVSQSICPKGWQLPTRFSNESYRTLFTSYGDYRINTPFYGNQSILEPPLSFTYGGYISNGSLQDMGSHGNYWMSTAYNASFAYSLGFSSTSVDDINKTDIRERGISIRCVAGGDIRTISDITYMQEMTMGICSNSDIEETKQLIDKRNNKSYWVTKLKDDNCWMTQNLDITDVTIGVADSDSTNFTIPASDSTSAFSVDNEYSPVAYDRFGYGGYYNWYTATAGTGHSSIADEGYNAPQSICPLGWRLPTGGDDGEFHSLLNGLTGAQAIAAPYNFQKGGIIFPDGLSNIGIGYYWSSTVQSESLAYELKVSSSVSTIDASMRHLGLSIRCIASGRRKLDNDNVKISVGPMISLDVADEVNIEKSETNPSTADLDVKVSSNQKYSVGISAKDLNLTSATSEVKIPAKSGLLNTADNGWGIKLKDDTEFTAITSDLQTFYTASGAEIKTIPFTIGISTAPDIPNGEYSTDITITATQN